MKSVKRMEKDLKRTRPRSNITFFKRCHEMRVEVVKDIQNHLLEMAPKALATKDQILSSRKESMWLKDKVATDVLDRLVPRPSQNVNIKGAIVTGQLTDEELKRLLIARLNAVGEEENEPTS
jgi:hypothetical protein